MSDKSIDINVNKASLTVLQQIKSAFEDINNTANAATHNIGERFKSLSDVIKTLGKDMAKNVDFKALEKQAATSLQGVQKSFKSLSSDVKSVGKAMQKDVDFKALQKQANSSLKDVQKSFKSLSGEMKTVGKAMQKDVDFKALQKQADNAIKGINKNFKALSNEAKAAGKAVDKNIDFKTIGKEADAATKKIQKDLKSIADTAKETGKEIDKNIDLKKGEEKAKKSTKSITGGFDELAEKLNSFKEKIDKAVDFSEKLTKGASDFDDLKDSIKSLSADGKDATANFNFIKGSIDTLHMPIKEAYGQFEALQKGLWGTGIEGNKLRDVFQGVGESSAAMNMKPEEFQGTIKALTDIGQHGTLQKEQMEELQKSFKGAQGEAARAMGMTASEFKEALDNGKIQSADFIARFGAQLHKDYATGAAEAGKSVAAKVNDIRNTFTAAKLGVQEKLKSMFDDVLPVVDLVKDGISGVSDALKMASEAGKIFNEIIEAGGAILEVIETINPLGLIIIGIAAAVAGFMLLWDHCRGFREFMGGLWAWMNKLLEGLGHGFTNVGVIISDVLDPSKWGNLVSDTKKLFTDLKSDLGSGWKEAWDKGAKAAGDSKFNFEKKLGIGDDDPADEKNKSVTKANKGLSKNNVVVGNTGEKDKHLKKSSTSTNPATHNAAKTSAVNGSNGVNSKVINMNFHSALQRIDKVEVKGGGSANEWDAASQKAIDFIMRALMNVGGTAAQTM